MSSFNNCLRSFVPPAQHHQVLVTAWTTFRAAVLQWTVIRAPQKQRSLAACQSLRATMTSFIPDYNRAHTNACTWVSSAHFSSDTLNKVSCM